MSDASTDQTPTDATTQPADDKAATAAAAVLPVSRSTAQAQNSADGVPASSAGR